VGQLTEKKRQLANVQAENKQLHAQLAVRSTNVPAGTVALPPGYIRRSQAQFVGYGNPENTIQSFLWAIQSHDLTNVSRAFSPEIAEKFLRDMANKPDPFVDVSALPGMRVVGQETMPDGRLNVEVEMSPNEPGPKIPFRQVNGEWKIDAN
jgi:hypothetical protein